MADETRTSNDTTERWPVSRSTSAWLAAQRQRTPEAHRAWVDEAVKQAQMAGELRAEVQDALATVQAVRETLTSRFGDVAALRDLALRLKAVLERTA